MKKTVMTFLLLIGLIIAMHADEFVILEKDDWKGTLNKLNQDGTGKFILTGDAALSSKKQFRIEDGKKYCISAVITRLNPSEKGKFYLGLIMLDKDKKVILPTHVMGVPGSLTELVSDCNVTDKKIVVKDASAWKTGTGYCVAFDARKDSGDLPNYNVSRLGVKDIKKLDDGTFKIELNYETGFEYPAGTWIREHITGATYQYFPVSQDDGKSVNSQFTLKSLRPGTESAGIIVVTRNDPQQKVSIENVSIKENE